MKKMYIIESRCIFCGEEVPEGWMVCPICLKKDEAKIFLGGSGADCSRPAPMPSIGSLRPTRWYHRLYQAVRRLMSTHKLRSKK